MWYLWGILQRPEISTGTEKVGGLVLPEIMVPPVTAESWGKRRAEIVQIFEENVYGKRPENDCCIHSRMLSSSTAYEGAGVRQLYEVQVKTERGSAAMLLSVLLPQGQDKVPCVLMISNHDKEERPAGKPDPARINKLFADAPSDWMEETKRMMQQWQTPQGNPGGNLLDITKDDDQDYWPEKTILASGHAAACFYASQAQADAAGGFPEGLSALFLNPDKPRDENGWGTLGVWAFAASCMISVLEEHPRIQSEKLSVAGHSRGGKTALWCAAQDTRVNAVLVNNSGCSGAAVSRGKRGEVVASICAMFPHWFCPNYARYGWREAQMPFDQHMLLAAVAPRLCYVTSGTLDAWSDPDAEWRGVKESSLIWESLGCPPLPQLPPQGGKAYQESCVGYHRRLGGHDLTRWDWEQFLHFLALHNG